MAWQMYKVTYELHGPLHIGYHKVGNVQRTRYYIPAHILWAAVTAVLTRCGFQTEGTPQGDYAKIGNWVGGHCAFSYWFIEENGKQLQPRYTEDGLRYDSMSVAAFERRYLNAHATTALDPLTLSAEDGSLHEVEYIAPYRQDGTRTRICGHVFLDEDAKKVLGKEEEWSKWLKYLHIGGERRYGFGRIHFLDIQQEEPSPENYRIDNARPLVRVERSNPLLAHTLANGLTGRGNIEPLVSRMTKTSDTFGRSLTGAAICWVPGTVLESTEWFEIIFDNTMPAWIWKRVNDNEKIQEFK